MIYSETQERKRERSTMVVPTWVRGARYISLKGKTKNRVFCEGHFGYLLQENRVDKNAKLRKSHLTFFFWTKYSINLFTSVCLFIPISLISYHQPSEYDSAIKNCYFETVKPIYKASTFNQRYSLFELNFRFSQLVYLHI